MDAEIAIIGAGVVGLALAQQLAGTRQVAVIDRNAGYGYETSSHNSGVVHAGIYYPTGSLKHTLCLEGNALTYEWCGAHSVRINRLGKLIIAVDGTDLDALDAVAGQAASNEVGAIERIADPARLRELEPSVRSVAALWSGSSGVVDQLGLMASFAAAATERGAWIALKHDVTAIERAEGGFRLTMRGPDGEETTVTAETLINSAGHGAPAIAHMLGYPLDGDDRTPRLRQAVNKGRYYDIVTPEKARAIRHLVYPVPEHAKGGLGVHVTLDIDGLVHLGPDTEWLDDSTVLDYRADGTRRAAFHAAASRYLPSLLEDDLAPGQVGYRPKLQAPGGPQADFLIWRDGPYVHLGGIESPGMTAALAIARHVQQLL
ncbi:MAG: NAD(P)/FAD-dependent oxidoreductase [Chloroflexi bacterium]|nr:NAD(P)/FAD-dependent oxidoreductase [Chloroflexota bacterium]